MMAGPAEAMLHVEDLALTFNPGLTNETKALQGVTLQVPPGEFVVILGSNGAGKSTLMHAIAGVHQPDRGTVTLAGSDVTFEPDYRRARLIGRVFQDPLAGTAPALTIAENLVLAERRGRRRRFRRPHRSERHREALTLLGMGLEDRLDTPVGMLSGGQRQALSVLMATRAEPALLMLDEHTAALDPAAASRVLATTEELVRGQGITTLMVTHNMAHAVELGDRTVMMHRGRVLFDLDRSARAGVTVKELVDRFHQLARDELSDRALLG